MRKIKTLSVVYAHHESHGPQIFAIELLSKYCKQVDLLYANVAETSWEFPANVTLIKDRKKLMAQETVYKKNIFKKWSYFFRFVFIMLKQIRRNRYDLIVLFNPPALLAIRIIYKLIPKKTIVWYHNYEPVDPTTVKKYSQGWFGYKAMKKTFSKIDFFSFSEKEREIFFPIHLLKTKYLIFPNYSLLELHDAKKREINDNKVKLLFSGVISPGNGLEEIIELLQSDIGGKGLELILKGYLKDDYKSQLLELAKKYQVQEKITIIPVGPWQDVPSVIRRGNIGINICTKRDITSQTLGKGGSGKIFQYIAEGLPVLINSDMKKYFEEYSWAIGTSLEQSSLKKNIEQIINNYDNLSQSAADSFKTELNCNIYFEELFQNVSAKINGALD